MEDLFMTAEQGERLRNLKKQVTQSKNYINTRKMPQLGEGSLQTDVGSASIDTPVITVNTVGTEGTEPGEPQQETPPKPRRKRRTKLQMMEAREAEAREAGDFTPPALAPIATIEATTGIINEVSTITVHNARAKPTLKRTPADTDDLLPESVAYLVSKVLKGKQLCMDDRELLEAEARTYKMGLLPFVHTHAEATKEFEAVLRNARASLLLKTKQGNSDASFDLDTAMSLTQDFPFLCSEANITLLDATLYDARTVRRRISVWRSEMRRRHGFDFPWLDAEQDIHHGDDLADMPAS